MQYAIKLMSSQNEDGHKTIFLFRDFSPKIIKSKFPPIGKDNDKITKGTSHVSGMK